MLPTMEWGRIVHSLPQYSFVLSYWFLLHINGLISICIELTLIILNMWNINNYDIMPPSNPPYQHLKQTLVDNAYYWKPHMEVNVNILIHISIAFHLWMDFILVFKKIMHPFISFKLLNHIHPCQINYITIML